MRTQLLLSILICAFSTGCGAVNKPAEGPPAMALLGDAGAYKAIYESDVPVLIEFCAESLPTSRLLTPIVTELTEKHKGQIKVVRMNADTSPETMQLFDVPALPCLVFVSKKQCKHGKLLVCVADRKEVENFIEQSLIQCRE